VINSVVLFLGCVFSAAVSGLFWMFARRARDRALARASAVAVVMFCAAAFYFGSRLWDANAANPHPASGSASPAPVRCYAGYLSGDQTPKGAA
jgi:hypothetical protein